MVHSLVEQQDSLQARLTDTKMINKDPVSTQIENTKQMHKLILVRPLASINSLSGI